VLTAAITENKITLREMFKSSLLSQFPSVKILEVGDGEELFKKLVFYPIDLTFMDTGLRGQGGLELTRKIKADRQDISIILSSYDFPEYRPGCTQLRSEWLYYDGFTKMGGLQGLR
jgi:DNA-binding NarL/FixJ family response regulator